MFTLNKVVLIGTLPEDPKLAWTEQGAAQCSLTLLLEEPGPDAHTYKLYIPIDVFGDKAEKVVESLNAGDTVLLDGKLRWKSWQHKKTGEQEGKLAVMAWRVSKLGEAQG